MILVRSVVQSVGDRPTLFHEDSDLWVSCIRLDNLKGTFEFMTCTDEELTELAAYYCWLD